jgi:prepilin-type processing-associated H-X9-DG protein
VAACIAGFTDRAALPAADQPGAPAKTSLPPDLAQVPPDALAFVHVRLSDLLQSELGKKLQQQLGKEMGQANQESRKRLGVSLEEIDRATVVMLSPKEEYPLVLISTLKPFDRQAVLHAALPGHQERQVKGKTYYTSKEAGRSALMFINDRVYLHGMVEDIVQFVVRPAPAEAKGPLSPALDLAAGKHQIVAGFNVPADATDQMKQELSGQHGSERLETVLAQGLKPLLEVRTLALAVDLRNEADVRVSLTFATEDAAKEAVWPARDGLALARLLMKPAIDKAGQDPGFVQLVPLLKQLESALRSTTVERQGAAVQAALRLPTDAGALGSMLPALVEATHHLRRNAERITSQNNLKQIVLAMHNYHDSMGAFPPAALCDKDGKPLLSWRVAILPYVEQANLYNQFKLDEPWDSAHNKKLLERMPPIYSPGQVKTKEPNTTFYQVFVGKGAGFEGRQGLRITDFTDGTSNTVLVVEAGDPVPWTKPEDLPYDDKKPLPKVGGLHPDGFNAAFADGSVRFLRKAIKEETLRALITRNGGEVINAADF